MTYSLVRAFGCCIVLTAFPGLFGVSTTFAQKPKKGSALAADGLRKDVDSLLKIKFSRTTEEAFRALVARPENSEEILESENLLRWVQAGDWTSVRELLDQFEPESARRIHAKILSDLAYSTPKSTMLPQDVLALADASPVELDERQIGHLSGLLRNTMRESESRTELVAQLHKGTERLGGSDPHRRRMAARMLAGADLLTEAKTFGLPERDLRPGAVVPDKSEEPVPPEAPEKRTWEQLVVALRDRSSLAAQSTALDELHELMLTTTPAALNNKLKALVDDRDHADVLRLVYGSIGQKTAAAGREVDLSSRAVHLEIQHRAMNQLAGAIMLNDEPWRTLANLYANNWLVEAQNSFKLFPNWQKSTGANRDRNAHVPIEHLIEHVPRGAWMATIEPQLSTTIRIMAARLALFSDNIDRTASYVRELIPFDPQAASKLANAYLEAWAIRHDPNLSPELQRLYKLENQVIVLTRAQQEASLKQLGDLLSSFDEPTRRLLDESQMVRAFDFCHSRAEIYTQQHLVEVFGPLDQISPSLLLTLTDRTRNKLASQWRDLAVQRDAATRRTAADVFDLVNRGYDESARVADAWLRSHPDDWRMNCAVGSLFSDWAEFAYFQSVVADDDSNRFATYLQHSEMALARFRAGAKAYAALVPTMKRSEFELLPYRSWFYGLLGITHDSGVNLRKGLTREGLNEIRKAMLGLPGAAGDAHLELFSAMVADNVTTNRIAPEMKYRYLSSAVQITGRRPTVYPAEEKIKFYDSLLKEIRLQTRLDGSDRIHAPGTFGVFVSLVHTADVARESGGFSKYVMNEVQRTVSGKTITEKPLYRDRFEESLRVALANFFDVRAIQYLDPKSGTRPIDVASEPNGVAWQETPLAYLLLATRDSTVDRVPALEIELDFFDRDGKVIIPVPSNPILVELSADAPPQRPASHVEMTQIVDARELSEQRLKIDVTATAHGLVPDLNSLLDLNSYGLPVTEVSETGNLLLRDLLSTADELSAVSERSWTIHLDPTPLLRGASRRVDFEFPRPTSKETNVTYRRYQDLDPVEAAAKFTLVEGDDVRKVAQADFRRWLAIAAGVLIVGLLLSFFLRGKPTASMRPPLFTLPREVTPFSVVSLLHRILSSPDVSFSDELRSSLRREIQSLEQAAFQREAAIVSRSELESLARRWLDVGQTTQSKN